MKKMNAQELRDAAKRDMDAKDNLNSTASGTVGTNVLPGVPGVAGTNVSPGAPKAQMPKEPQGVATGTSQDGQESQNIPGDTPQNRNPIYFILENVYDTYNVGGLFRLADALAVRGMYLVGDTETPPNNRILKASIGTYKVVPWKYASTVIDALKDIRTGDPTLKSIAVEQSERSVPYTEIPRWSQEQAPVALILGNETYGVSPDTLDQVDYIAEIPMWGINKSLNVIVSAAIVGYYCVQKKYDSI